MIYGSPLTAGTEMPSKHQPVHSPNEDRTVLSILVSQPQEREYRTIFSIILTNFLDAALVMHR